MSQTLRGRILPLASGPWRSILPGLGLLAMVAVTWGVFLGRTGFYWDDWPVLWVFDELGPAGLDTFFSADRPLYKMVYKILMPVFGANAAPWLVTLLGFLFLTGWLWYAVLVDLWPRQRLLAWMAASFAIVYPGFTDNVIAFSYVQHYMASALYLVSLRLSIAAVRSSGGRAIAALAGAAVTTATSFLLVEYFVGLELARGFLLLVALDPSRPLRKRLVRDGKRALVFWAPTFAVLVAFVAYQFQTAAYDAADYRHAATLASEVTQGPIATILGKALLAIQNLLSATVLSWSRPIEPRLIDFTWGFSILASWVALFAVTVIVVVVAIWRGFHREEDTAGPACRDHVQIAIIALLLVAACGLPMAFADLRIRFDWDSRDRFSIPFLFGSSLLLMVLIRGVARTRLRALVLAALAIGLAASFQFREANSLRTQWAEHREIFWQFAWRFPQLEPGTSVMIEGMPIMISDNLAGANLNLMYGPGPQAGDLDYYFFDLQRDRTYRSFVPLPVVGEPTHGKLRMFTFGGTTSQLLVVGIPEKGAVRFVDPLHLDEMPHLGPAARRVAALSGPQLALGRVEVGSIEEFPPPPGPLLSIFGREPSRGWNYHFQKAELARQLELWSDVVALEEQARSVGLRPELAEEWTPFIEARMRRGEVDAAIELTRVAIVQDAYVLSAVAALWQRVSGESERLSAELWERDADLARHVGVESEPGVLPGE